MQITLTRAQFIERVGEDTLEMLMQSPVSFAPNCNRVPGQTEFWRMEQIAPDAAVAAVYRVKNEIIVKMGLERLALTPVEYLILSD